MFFPSIFCISKIPSVSVPVLSKTTVPKFASFSIQLLPLISIPIFDAAPIPEKKLNGIDITNAHGHDTTKNDSALYSQVWNGPQPSTNVGNVTKHIAMTTTIGVQNFANLVINFSDLDFFWLAFSTKSKILQTVDSPNSFVTCISSTLFLFMHPLNTSSFSVTCFGTDSPS